MLVKQISNLFELMDLFVRAKKPLSVREIVEEYSWPRSSVFNTVSTLVELGYLYQPVSRGGYYPTSRWMELARDLAESQPLPDSVHELLVDLVNETGETVSLAAPDGTNVVLLDVAESSAVVRYTASVGQRLPMHVTAAGKAILSQYSPSERAALLKRIDFRRFDGSALMNAEVVEKDIQQGSGNGWYVNLGSYVQDLAGIAVPFPFRNRRNAIVIGAPVSRVAQRVESLGKLLNEVVSRFLDANEG